MATSGLIALTSTSKVEVAVTRLNAEESHAGESRASRLVEARVNARLGRSDFRHVPLLRSVENRSRPGTSFQQFLASYRAPELVYGDVYETHGEAVVDRDESLAQFRSAGGIVTHVD